MFNNLIDNARSFSQPGGSVRVGLRPAKDALANGLPSDGFEIIVDDDGPGIPADAFERIFERFYTDRPNQGFGQNSGLGLSISRQIIEAHGGRIRAMNRIATGRRRRADHSRRALRRLAAGGAVSVDGPPRHPSRSTPVRVVVGEAGILIRGASGAGKSSLALALAGGGGADSAFSAR